MKKAGPVDSYDRAEDLVIQGISYARMGKHLKAIDVFLHALEQIPGSAMISYNLALEYLSLNKPEEALAYLNTAVRTDPENPDYWCEHGIALYRLKEYPAAEESYDRAMSCGGESARLWNSLAVLRFVTERYAEAKDFFNRAVQLDPLNQDAWYNLADTLEQLGDFKEAGRARTQYKKLSSRGES